MNLIQALLQTLKTKLYTTLVALAKFINSSSSSFISSFSVICSISISILFISVFSTNCLTLSIGSNSCIFAFRVAVFCLSKSSLVFFTASHTSSVRPKQRLQGVVLLRTPRNFNRQLQHQKKSSCPPPRPGGAERTPLYPRTHCRLSFVSCRTGMPHDAQVPPAPGMVQGRAGAWFIYVTAPERVLNTSSTTLAVHARKTPRHPG